MRVIDWLFLISLVAVVDFGIVAVFLWPVDQPKPRYVIIRVPAPQAIAGPTPVIPPAPVFKPPPLKRHKPKFCLPRQKLTDLYNELDSWMSSSAVDRIRSKAIKAKGVVGRVIANVEADLDSINAAEPELEKRRQEAVAPHFAAINETKTELDGIRDALSILSNGGPALDPLEESEHTAHSSLDPALDQEGKK